MKRTTKLKYLIIHHTGTYQFFTGWESFDVQKFFSKIGFWRGYANYQYNQHTGESPTGKETNLIPNTNTPSFSMAQYCMYKASDEKWKIIELIEDPIENVTGSLGLYTINQQSINLEICGDWRYEYIGEDMLDLIAIYFCDIVRQNNLEIQGHRFFESTACPGKIIDQIELIRQKIWKV